MSILPVHISPATRAANRSCWPGATRSNGIKNGLFDISQRLVHGVGSMCTAGGWLSPGRSRNVRDSLQVLDQGGCELPLRGRKISAAAGAKLRASARAKTSISLARKGKR